MVNVIVGPSEDLPTPPSLRGLPPSSTTGQRQGHGLEHERFVRVRRKRRRSRSLRDRVEVPRQVHRHEATVDAAPHGLLRLVRQTPVVLREPDRTRLTRRACVVELQRVAANTTTGDEQRGAAAAAAPFRSRRLERLLLR
jgi:hypothetical protein